MTARSIPPVLERRDGFIGEYDVWERLRDELPDGTVLLCGAKVPQGPSGREIDFLVLWPGLGIAVVEVKGGAVAVTPRAGGGRTGRATVARSRTRWRRPRPSATSCTTSCGPRPTARHTLARSTWW